MRLRRDVSGFYVRLTEAMIAAKVASLAWPNRTIAQLAAEHVRQDPDRIILVDGKEQISQGRLLDEARRFGEALRRRGLRVGEVVAFQLPNWYEATVVHLAAAIEGFVSLPIVPIYRDAEAKFILREARARALVTTSTFRKFDYLQMVRRVATDLPLLDEVIVVRGERSEFTAYTDLIRESAGDERPSPVDPNAVKMIMYTSGTTGPAKGVLHSHNTLLAEVGHYRDNWQIGPSDVILMPSSICHIAGLAWAAETPWALGARAILTEQWRADEAVQTMLQQRATVMVRPTVFLQELLDACKRADTVLPDLRLFICGGASVPPDLVRRAHVELPHCMTARVYGATEVSSVTYGVFNENDREYAALTDGRIGQGWELKIVDAETGSPLPPGADGEILARGDEMMIGYSRPEDTLAAFDEEGYFRTGDIGHIVDERFLLITDRKKDLVIRGGENISSREIEDALQSMPGLGPVAVVGMPCPRMGETVCLFVETRGYRSSVDKRAIVDFLERAGMARQKLPERVEPIAELPRTPSGKVRKNVLRQLIAAQMQEEQGG